MVYYSKQWCDLCNLETQTNFDIELVANSLIPGSYKPIVCHGFGFTAIGKTKENVIQLYFKNKVGIMSPPSLDTDDWVDLETMLQTKRDEIQNNGN